MQNPRHTAYIASLFLGLSLLLHFPVQYWHHAFEEEKVEHADQHTGHEGLCAAEVEHCDLCDFTLAPLQHLSWQIYAHFDWLLPQDQAVQPICYLPFQLRLPSWRGPPVG